MKAQEERPHRAFVLQLDDDTINPITAEYISRAIDQAEEEAEFVILKLDTPGGLLTSTRTIVKKILSSAVPVVVYIYPSGSRAGSAGVFITYASHVAAMAPSTNIGAAHPVEIGEGKKGKEHTNRGMEEINKKLQQLLNQNQKKDKRNSRNQDSEMKGQTSEDETHRGHNPSVENTNPEKPEGLEEGEKDSEDPMADKILNDTVAFIRGMAELRHRNVEWAIESVTQSASITETEALQKGVVEIIAKNDQDLLAQLNGRSVKIKGRDVTISTTDIQLVDLPMSARQRFFNVLANPNLAYIFMILGFYGLLYEITHPGIALPGILGAVLLILAFYSFQALPTNYAALALILLALILFVLEATTPGFGILALTGVGCMVLGSLLLFDTSIPNVSLSLSIILSFTLTTAGLTLFLVHRVLSAHKLKKRTGTEGMIGEVGYAFTDLWKGKVGKVFVHGEIWNALAHEDIVKNEDIRVLKIEGMTLTVKKKT